MTTDDDDDTPSKSGKPLARYRKVEVRTWGDEKFRSLSPIAPGGQGLWLFLITGPHTNSIPGLFRAGRASMAEELGWELEAFDKAFAEVFQQGMVKGDFKARVMWVPKAVAHNKPSSPNVVKHWAVEFDLIPECDLKREAYQSLKATIHAMGEAFGKAFDEAFVNPYRKPLAKTLANHKQDFKQEPEQQQQAKQVQTLTPAAQGKPHPTGSVISGAATRKRVATPAGKGVEAWEAYANAYEIRYGAPPVRNASVNSQLAQVVDRLGAADAPAVAAFFVNQQNGLYVTAMHPVNLLLRDAEKIRTEWFTGRTVTRTQGMHADRTQTNANSFAPLIAAAMAEDAADAAAAAAEELRKRNGKT